MRTHNNSIFLAAFLLLMPVAVSAEVSERWMDPPLQKMRELTPLKKQTCGSAKVTTIVGQEGGQSFDLRVIAMPNAVNFLNILIYKQPGKDRRVAYFLNAASSSLDYFQKPIEPQVFEGDIFSISFEYSQYLLEEFGDQHDLSLLGKKWCTDELLE